MVLLTEIGNQREGAFWGDGDKATPERLCDIAIEAATGILDLRKVRAGGTDL